MQSRIFPYIVLFTGVLIASTAAIMIRVAIDLHVPPLTIAAGRLGLAALILMPIAWTRSKDELRSIERRDWLLALGAGAFLAIHFAAWITSLAYTSVASSTALVTTNPIFVSLASWLIFRERLGAVVWTGVLLTVGGSILIGLSDSTTGGSNALLGNALALLGAMTVSGYFLIGRNLRNRLSILPYIWLVYTAGAVILLLLLAFSGQSLFGWPPVVYLLLLGLALGPQLLGHTAFNWAIKYLSATVVTVAILGEPISSALLALVLLPDQSLKPLQLIGAAVLLIGIAVVVVGERCTRQPTPQEIEVESAVAP